MKYLAHLKYFFAFILLFSVSTFSHAKFSVDQVFSFHHEIEGKNLVLTWQIAKDHHLYKKELRLVNDANQIININNQDIQSVPRQYFDDYFGEVEIFDYELVIKKPLKDIFIQSAPKVQISYQGCTTGLCYPAQSVVIDLTDVQAQLTKGTPIHKMSEDDSKEVGKSGKSTVDASSNDYDRYLEGWGILFFFVLGIGLTFTPCVLPMMPLLSSIIVDQEKSKMQSLLLGVSYVQGMAITYTLLGLLVASVGMQFSIFLQSKPVLIGLSILFILLALSNFGLFTLKIPFSQKVSQLNNQLNGGSVVKTFIMGIVAGLVASPCTSAPLSGILLYVAQKGDLLTGALALYLLALGIGLPLILVILFGKQILPKSGDWLLKVKTIFGFVLLLLPVVLLSRAFNEEWLYYGIFGLIFFYWLSQQKVKSPYWRHALLMVSLVGFTLSAQPIIQKWNAQYHSEQQEQIFEKVSTLAEIQQRIENKDYIVVDFFANWCSACKEYEHLFKQKDVATLLKGNSIQVDLSQNSEENQKIMKHFNIVGLPAILIYENGKVDRINRLLDKSQLVEQLTKKEKFRQ